ncbi:glucosamine-6-phosphate deaminase [Changpingibacter yushuensis]|uniref:glucosamine-6-phosphate deaminase n=1 Tax=Changpingibacter yushuensis TaxID=2758440 RepID=UPI0015F6D9A9|nr:glucosamine-6-phosphate deaminase [Changpingibacter yushuensis]
MHLGIFDNSDQASSAAAHVVINLFAQKPNATLGVATGSTPSGLYRELRAAHAAGDFSLKKSQVFALDEYVGIAEDHPERYRNVLRRELVGKENVGLTEEGLHTPDASAEDPNVAALHYDREIGAVGGIDLQILGIGTDGHIGFNEPGGSLVSRTHAEPLASQTITDNARFFDGDVSKVPTTCITQGLGTIMEARQIVLLAFGANKANALAQLIEGPISAKWPATILQMHPDVVVIADKAAASTLEYTDLYVERWQLAFGD